MSDAQDRLAAMSDVYGRLDALKRRVEAIERRMGGGADVRVEPEPPAASPDIVAFPLARERDAARRLRDGLERLVAAARPFARVAPGIPDNWPGQCVLNFHAGVDGGQYLGYPGKIDDPRHPTIGDYRRLANAVRAAEEAAGGDGDTVPAATPEAATPQVSPPAPPSLPPTNPDAPPSLPPGWDGTIRGVYRHPDGWEVLPAPSHHESWWLLCPPGGEVLRAGGGQLRYFPDADSAIRAAEVLRAAGRPESEREGRRESVPGTPPDPSVVARAFPPGWHRSRPEDYVAHPASDLVVLPGEHGFYLRSGDGRGDLEGIYPDEITAVRAAEVRRREREPEDSEHGARVGEVS